MTVKESVTPAAVGRGRGRPREGQSTARVGVASQPVAPQPVAPPASSDAVPEDREEGEDYWKTEDY